MGEAKFWNTVWHMSLPYLLEHFVLIDPDRIIVVYLYFKVIPQNKIYICLSNQMIISFHLHINFPEKVHNNRYRHVLLAPLVSIRAKENPTKLAWKICSSSSHMAMMVEGVESQSGYKSNWAILLPDLSQYHTSFLKISR